MKKDQMEPEMQEVVWNKSATLHLLLMVDKHTLSTPTLESPSHIRNLWHNLFFKSITFLYLFSASQV